jgi:error-prone DNA polymerase
VGLTRARADPSFVHLDVRSCFSLKEGAFTPEQLARRAAELGMPAVALTDRDGLYGAARFVRACQQEGVRPILGASLTVRAPAPPPDDAHLVLLATDDTGYANLCRLITDAHMLGERGDPWVALEQICAHADGMVALAGPRSHAGRLAARGRVDAGARALAPLREAFGASRVFVAAEHRMEADSSGEIRAMLRLAERAEVGAVATNPVRYLVPEDAFLADALECMRRIVPVASTNVTRANAEGYVKASEAMHFLFRERPDLCRASMEIADACRFDLGLKRTRFPDFPTPAGRSADAVLAERCWQGVHERGMREDEALRDRMHLELSMIRRMGYAAFFLTVAGIAADIRAMGVRCACRGSAAGSLVCYLTGISDVDALEHDLSFERFMNPMRDDLPDIDIDVESARREDVYDMILSHHGQDRAGCVAMIDTYRARSSIREVGKALGMPDVELGQIATSFPHISARHLREAMDRLPELQGMNLRFEQLELLFRVAERLDGFPRHIALHPCGIVLAGHDLVERVPLERSANGHRVVQADKDDVELLGYLKLDILGVRMLSSMRHALDEIARTTGEKVDLGRIAQDDPATLELIRASDTLGCFQIESPGQRELLQKLQPTRWADLIVDISLFRPGPVKSDMIRPFLKRRAGLERPVYAHPDLKAALGETHGVIVYHEQVMRTLAAIAGYDLTYADHIRRHLDRDDLLPGFRKDFLQKAQTRGVDRAAAERIWDDVTQFASFGFCKAHAAAFAVPTYQSAWLKAHYPAHLIAGLLTHDPGMYPRRLILEDARLHGIPILPLDVNRSEPEYVVEELQADTPDPIGGNRGSVGPVPGLLVSARIRSLRSSTPGDDPPSTGVPPPNFSGFPVGGVSWPAEGAGSAERRRATRMAMSGDEQLGRAPTEPRFPKGGSQPGDGPDRATVPEEWFGGVSKDGPTFGIRLALQDVHGISDAEIRSILRGRTERPFRDVGDFLRRTAVARPVVEAIAHAGGFDALPGKRRNHLYAAMTTEAAREGDQLTLADAAAPAPAHRFRDYSDAEVVRAELEVLGLDATRHIVSFFEPLLADLGVTRTKDLPSCRGGQKVMVAGVKVASQTPAIRSGQRIIFLTLDDATGPVEVTVFESVQPKVAKTVFHAYAMVVWGELRRTGVKGVSVIAEEVWDLTALHRARGEGRLREAMATPAAPTPAPRRLWHASPGSAG